MTESSDKLRTITHLPPTANEDQSHIQHVKPDDDAISEQEEQLSEHDGDNSYNDETGSENDQEVKEMIYITLPVINDILSPLNNATSCNAPLLTSINQSFQAMDPKVNKFLEEAQKERKNDKIEEALQILNLAIVSDYNFSVTCSVD